MKIDQLFGKKDKSLMTIRDGASNFIVSLILMFILQFVVTIVLMMTKVDSASFSGTVAYSCIICFINEFAFVITPFIYCKVLDVHYVKDINFKKGVNIYQVLILVAIAVFTIMFSSPIANYFVKFVLWTGFDISKLSLLNITTWQELIAGLIFIALIPAVCEEILYRGIIARSFKSKNVIFGIFMSAFLFAIMHGSPIQLVHQFVIGVICCIVYFITKSIYAPIIVHFSNNAITLVGGFIENKSSFNGAGLDWIYIIMIIVGLIVLPMLLYALVKKSSLSFNREESIKQNIENICKFDIEKERENTILEGQEKVKEFIESSEMQEVLDNEIKQRSQKNDHIDRRALIYALILGMAIWILQTLMCYI